MTGRTASLRHRSRSRSPSRPWNSAPKESLPGLLPTPQSPSTGPQPSALYLGYPQNIELPSDSQLIRVFLRYGPVLRVYAHRTPRVYVIVDYQNSADALRALHELYLNDKTGSRRAELGDPSLTISFKTDKPKESKKRAFWTGELSLHSHKPASVTAALLEGDCTALFSCFSQVAIAHRAPVNEVLMRDALAVLVFTGATEESKRELSDIAEYFYTKQRAGFVSMQKYHFYLLPPGPESFLFVPTLESHQLVGVLVDASA